jgi:hypothetical protein
MTDQFDEVLTQLEPLRFTPARSEAVARSGLQAFLHEAAGLHPTVSARPQWRLTGWISQFQLRSKFTQERSPMLALAIKLVLVLAVMFGGAGVTAAAAQSSLPNEALYPVKLLIEEVQWGSAQGPEAQIDVQLDHAQQRVREMVQLTNRGAAIPAEVPARLQTRLQAALHIAVQLDDQQMSGALDRIQLRTQDQLREMDQLHLNEAAGILTQVREIAQLGQRDPQAFRALFGPGRPDDVPPLPPMTPRADPSRTPQGPRASLTPQPSRTPPPSPTPQATNTPRATGTQQGNSYGPGPQTTPDQNATNQPVVTPVGNGAGHEYGPQPTAVPGGGEPQPQNTPQGSGGDPAPQNTPQAGGGGNGPQPQNTPAPASTPQGPSGSGSGGAR